LSYFDMAADCDAQNGTYAAELAWTRYQLMISTAALTLKTLRNAMRIDPRAGAAFLYTGKIHAILGNKLEAEGYLRKAASLMPRDRRPGEALKQLLGK
jgi:Tfp pilus assembly protein PilF